MKCPVLVLFCALIALNACGGPEQHDDHRHQLWLIDSLRQFAKSEMHLQLLPQFYTKWDTGHDSMYIYLYVSRPDTIMWYDGIERNSFFFENEDAALAKAKVLREEGLQTLIYKTAGTSNTLLNNKLLSYPDEAIAFIVFHEATHQHIHAQSAGSFYPYMYEECLCDVVANYACSFFADKTGMIEKQRAVNQTAVFEKCYAFLNEQKTKLNATPGKNKSKIFKKCTAKVKQMTAGGNAFQKDRMNYEVNNAYFLRQDLYASRYFEMKQMLTDYFDLNTVIDKIIQQHSSVKGAEKEIELKGNNFNNWKPLWKNMLQK